MGFDATADVSAVNRSPLPTLPRRPYVWMTPEWLRTLVEL